MWNVTPSRFSGGTPPAFGGVPPSPADTPTPPVHQGSLQSMRAPHQWRPEGTPWGTRAAFHTDAPLIDIDTDADEDESSIYAYAPPVCPGSQSMHMPDQYQWRPAGTFLGCRAAAAAHLTGRGCCFSNWKSASPS
jgi:hypothetical protein